MKLRGGKNFCHSFVSINAKNSRFQLFQCGMFKLISHIETISDDERENFAVDSVEIVSHRPHLLKFQSFQNKNSPSAYLKLPPAVQGVSVEAPKETS
jgi:hypothetical protein